MKTPKTLQEEIDVIINRHSPMENFEVKEQCAEEILTTLTTAIIKQAVEKIEVGKEEVRYGMDTMYGDTDHPHPSVIFGKNEAKDEDIAILRSLLDNK